MATILPLGETTFFDVNGDPLAGGTVEFYIPGTTTMKDTYQDSQQVVLNSNPVVLDSAGRAIIFGSGSYRQVVKDDLGNIVWDTTTGEPNAGIVSSGGTSGGTANAQTLSAGTFEGTDGATIQFTAGISNTGPTTLSVGGGSPIAVLKNGPSGPVQLASGDIVAGNIYSVAYSSVQAAFQLLTSIPPTFSIASQPEAEAGTNNTNLMTPLRVAQEINGLSGIIFKDGTKAITKSQTDNSQNLATTAFVRTAAKINNINRFFDPASLLVASGYATIGQVIVPKLAGLQSIRLEWSFLVGSGALASGSQTRVFNVSENRSVAEMTVSLGATSGFTFMTFDNAQAALTSVTYVVQARTPSGSAGLIQRAFEGLSYNF
jgi:hypothetical protein